SVKNQEVRLVEDVRKDPLFSPQIDQFTGLNTTSILCAPLIHENRPLGAVEIINTRRGSPCTESDKEIIVLVAKFAAEAIAVAEKAASA
ncbi:MAG: GAF domain-containing protein, partial [Chloroflexota bacterium]